VPDELLARLGSVAVATLSAQLRRRGLNDVSVDGVHPARPGSRFTGRARTLRYLPHRPDLFDERGGGFNAQKRAIESVGPGEVLVMDARGERGTGTIGDILALRAQVRGAAAIVTDGGLRDAAAVAELDIPVFHAGAHPAVLGRRHVPWEIDVAIACGGTTVLPGDILAGDDDGVVVIPPAIAEEVLTDAVEQERQERFVTEQVAAGAPVDGLYPLSGSWLTRYQDWLGTQ
jgi:regulator of RNase E activity RraA